MNWISKLDSPGHIGSAVNTYNYSIEKLNKSEYFQPLMVDVSRSLFDSMNNIQTAWRTYKIDTGDNEKGGEISDFQSMIIETINKDEYIDLLQSKQIKDFIFLEPRIQNHKYLTSHGYKPGQGIKPKLEKKATEEHRKLVDEYERYLAGQSDQNPEVKVLKKMAALLYIVRSNMAHGEKTIYGPDHAAIKRNRIVSEKVIHLQILLLSLLLDRPDRRLVVYGTLAPGKVNHNILSKIEGSWSRCEVNGRIFENNGLPYFIWDPNEPSNEFQLFFSNMLPDSWNRLDQFEGSKYNRTLVPLKINKNICVANIFTAKNEYS